MKKISLLIIAILALAGCTKSQVYEANILGTWGESYDPTKFAFDGVLRYTFDDGNTYTLYTSNPDGSSQNTITGNYVLASKGNYIQKIHWRRHYHSQSRELRRQQRNLFHCKTYFR